MWFATAVISKIRSEDNQLLKQYEVLGYSLGRFLYFEISVISIHWEFNECLLQEFTNQMQFRLTMETTQPITYQCRIHLSDRPHI